MMLKSKVAVIYGAGGAVGGAVESSFAPESGTIKEVFGLQAKAWGISWEQFHEVIAGRTHTQRLSTLAEMANVAAFMASDAASALTGTVVNLSMGSIAD